MNICVLGRQPAIGLAELEALYGADAVTPFGENAALVDAKVDFSRLGSTVKMASVSMQFQGFNLPRAFDWAAKNLPLRLHNTSGKLQIGISLYGASLPIPKLNAHGLSLKKSLRQAGHSVRVTPNIEPALSSAQSFHNKLAGRQGYELIIATDGNKTVIARLTNVQDIDAYTLRDRERPKRDTFVGMLPPKLAQTIINLAEGAGSSHRLRQEVSSTQTNATPAATLLDPFCGTGVVLMEAALIGYSVYGTDLQEKMVRYTRDNMNWLQATYLTKANIQYETADATGHIWRQPINLVACEGYLGQPLGGQSPSPQKLSDIINECDNTMRDFLINIHGQLSSGAGLCIAMPTWQIDRRAYHLPLLDSLEKMGYNRIDFVHASHTQLVYRRDDQTVGRELVVITKE